MKDQYDVDVLCVEVFSKISATVTHEIKNTLSIINENAGFLGDLAEMAGEDGSIPSQRIDDATTSITNQVSRANTIMKNLNRFSHSGDSPISQATLLDLLQLMVELTSRQAASRSVDVTINCPDDITIKTTLLPLEALLFYLLDNIYSASPAEKTTLRVEACVKNSDVEIRFIGAKGQTDAFEQYRLGDKEHTLAEAIKGACSKSSNEITLSFPSHRELK